MESIKRVKCNGEEERETEGADSSPERVEVLSTEKSPSISAQEDKYALSPGRKRIATDSILTSEDCEVKQVGIPHSLREIRQKCIILARNCHPRK